MTPKNISIVLYICSLSEQVALSILCLAPWRYTYGCNVAWYENKRVMLKANPSEPAAKMQYHNELMVLCSLSLRELVEAMQKAKRKHDEKAQREVPEDRAPSPARSRSPRG